MENIFLGFLFGCAFYLVLDSIIDRTIQKVQSYSAKKSDKGLNIKKDKE